MRHTCIHTGKWLHLSRRIHKSIPLPASTRIHTGKWLHLRRINTSTPYIPLPYKVYLSLIALPLQIRPFDLLKGILWAIIFLMRINVSRLKWIMWCFVAFYMRFHTCSHTFIYLERLQNKSNCFSFCTVTSTFFCSRHQVREIR